ncbi:MAG: cupin domain-containing protein [Lentisphaerota bacterium]
MGIKDSNQIQFAKVDIAKDTFMQVLIPIQPDENDNFIMRKFIIKKGGMIPFHKNLVEHQQYVLSGKAELRIEDEVSIARRDSVVYIPAGVPHYYKNLGDTDFEFLCIIPKKADQMTLTE